MRRTGLPLTGLLTFSLVLLAPLAGAQQGQGGMGLDLSGSDTSSNSTDNKEAPAGGDEQAGPIGLDLSGDSSSAALVPHIVLLGMDTPERAGAAASGRWLKGLFTSARSNEQWVLSAPLKEVRKKLGKGYLATLRCTEVACMTESAETFEAELVVTARLALEDDGWTFRLWTYDSDRNKVETDSITGRNPKDVKFQKAGAALLAQRLKGLARKRAILAVKVNVPQAVVKLGERVLGTGSLERNVAPGDTSLVVEANGFTTYNKPVSLKPGEKTSVKAYLQLSSGAAVAATPTEGPSEGPSEPVAEVTTAQTKRESSSSNPTVLRRPALYTAVVGALVMGAGVAVRMQAKSLADKAPDTDGNGIANITRQERLDLKSKANLSAALLAGGAAVAGASAVWLAVVPTKSAAPKGAAPSVAPGAAGGGAPSTALHVLVGGSF